MTSFLDRLLGRAEPAPVKYAKAVTDIYPWSGGPLLSSLTVEPQQKAATYLRAYRTGWFYKAGSKISSDVSTLDWSVSDGDAEEGEEETTLDRPALDIPFDALSPIDQFQRLLERPNPSYTGRTLLQKTQIRLDFAGAVAWYMEGGEFGLPTALYGISPARMWPSFDKAGNLIGWVMDKDSQNPVTFSPAEILWFTTANETDDNLWGVSVVEAVYSQVPLTDALARHTANVLTTGGRLAGMMWPKERGLTEDEFVDAQRAWRNVASDPNAARRLLIFPEPMEWQQGAATPEEIGIPELATLSRDEILTAFPISPYQLGVPTPGGLNSGEVRREDRRDYWEGTIHPRADLIEEFVQVYLLSKYEKVLGQTFNFELEEPNLDDATSLTAKAEAYKALVAIGSDPKEAYTAVGLSAIKWLGLPDLLDPAKQAMAQEEARQAQAQAFANRPETPPPPAKAEKSTQSDREKVQSKAIPDAMLALNAFFDEQRQRIADNVRERMPADKRARKDFDDWWDEDLENAELSATLRGLYTTVGRGGLTAVANSLERVVLPLAVRRVIEDLIGYGGSRIVGINEATRTAINETLAEGVRRGYSVTQMVEGYAAEGYPGIFGAVLENGTPVFGDLRAETIARTETMLSYNRAALDGYKEYQVRYVVAFDGDEDAECAERDGQEFAIEDALGIEDHPNGTLDWAPVVDKSYHPSHDGNEVILKAIEALTRPQDIHVHTTPPDVTMPAPIVNVEPPNLGPVLDALIELRDEVKAVEPPVVNVPAPVVNLPPPVVNVKAPSVTDVRVTSLPERKHSIVRDKQGKPTHSVETDA